MERAPEVGTEGTGAVGAERHRFSRRQLLIFGAGGAVALGGIGYGVAQWVGVGTPSPPASPFMSEPGLHPPTVTVTVPPAGTAPGLIFVGPGGTAYQHGPMIVDERGRLVWFRPLPTGIALNVGVQQYRGEPVVAWWEGQVLLPAGYGQGDYPILDTSYREVARVKAGNGLMGDLHELVLTPEGTALITVYRPIPADLSAAGGPVNGTLLDSGFQEVDIATGRVLTQWNASDHVALDETYLSAATSSGEGFDFFHINSIDVDTDGDLLISGRHTWAVYKVRRHAGDIVWRLNGKRSDFVMGRGATFGFQHDARHHAGGRLSLFDDGGGPPNVRTESRGIILSLDLAVMTATLVQQFVPDPTFVSTSQGSVQVLPDGHVFVGWGEQPYWSEYTADGRLLYDARFPDGQGSYRAFRAPWTATPSTRPAVATQPASGGTSVYASWNGATDVDRWQVLAGPHVGQLRTVASLPHRSFEDAVTIRATSGYVVAAAVGSDGRRLATSEPIAL